MKTFLCSRCGETKQNNETFTTGYGVDNSGNIVCYECCAKQDVETLENTGKLHGYFTKKDGKNFFTNWPASLSIPVFYTRKSWHNFAGRDGRTDFWLTYNGKNYHGVQIGHNNECATIRKTKS